MRLIITNHRLIYPLNTITSVSTNFSSKVWRTTAATTLRLLGPRCFASRGQKRNSWPLRTFISDKSRWKITRDYRNCIDIEKDERFSLEVFSICISETNEWLVMPIFPWNPKKSLFFLSLMTYFQRDTLRLESILT